MKQENFRKVLTEVFTEWKWLFKYVRRYWWGITAYIVIGIVAIAMGLGAGIASKHLIDAVVNRVEAAIFPAGAMVIGLALLQVVFQAVSSLVTSRIGTRVSMEIRADFFERITATTWENIRAYHSGDLINRLEGDITAISSGIINFLPSVVTRLAQFIGSAVVIFYYDKTMALLALLGSPLIFLTSNYMMKKIRVYNKKSRDMNGKIISFGEETLHNMQMVKSFGLNERYTNNFKMLLKQFRDVKLEYDKFSILTTIALSVVGLIVSYSCYGWGVWRLWHGAITYGTMTLFLQLSGNLTNSFSSLVSMAPSIISIATAAGRIMEITQLPEEADDEAKEAEKMLEKAKQGKVGIVAENVSFMYSDGDDYVLKKADFTIKAGETVAIIGPSGEGKTTALRLILGLLNATKGNISFVADDGQSLKPSLSTRRLCSYVPQINNIIYGTVAENLRAVKENATDEELIEVLKMADAWDFVSEMHGGLNARIGERNNNLSEGQAQRISIARAVLRNAPILLMDEATSALDTDTEKRVLKNIMKRSPEKICVLTTHRPSMLKYCTRVYKIDEDGSFIIYDSKENDIDA